MKCCEITAGMLREPADIQTQTTSSIGGGATSLAYTTRATVRGQMMPLSGNQVMYADRKDARTRNRFLMRYRSDLTESDRMVIRGRAYNITYIDNVEFLNRWHVVSIDGGVAT